MNLSLEQLSMTYPSGKRALKSINLELESPSMIGLLGPNGAGKSTLIRLLVAGMLPTEGEIRLDGKPLLTQEKALKRRLGYLPQSFGVYDELTVWQFLDYMSALKGTENSRAAIAKVIEETNLKEKAKSRISTLSGGQRQRLGIAQALLGSPDFLIFDEPTVGLDPEERINFRNLFSRAAQDKIVLLSTHIIEDIQSICGRLIVLHNGAVRFDGKPEVLIRQAEGHVGWFLASEAEQGDESTYHITNRLNTADGVACRVVADKLPAFARPAAPTLEDAYMYLTEKGAGE